MYSKLDLNINQDSLAYLYTKLKPLLTKNLVLNSNSITPGDVFCAYPGALVDGRDFINQAIKNHAAAILYEKYPNQKELFLTIPSFAVKNLKHYLGVLASLKNKTLTKPHKLIGVTGTNGKTSINYWLAQAFNTLNEKIAIIGTTGSGVFPKIIEPNRTTPDPITLQQKIKDFSQQNVNYISMEVSSHALDQGRVNGCTFKYAVFTNLTQDHLDYHLDMENYYLAKKKLFFWQNLEYAIINADDPYGSRLINELRAENPGLKIISYGITNGDFKAQEIKLLTNHLQFKISHQGDKVLISTPIIGRFNVYNLLATSLVLTLSNNLNLNTLPTILTKLTPVAGRMETIELKNKPLVIIDYAHTPDGLEKALTTLQEIKATQAKLWCVFGCGGNRDKTKRELMGKIASVRSDYLIITSDNPRDEEPLEIIQEISQSIPTNNYQVLESREEAIKAAITNASNKDIILIAGKGHEEYQEIKGVKYPFSDTKTALKYLQA